MEKEKKKEERQVEAATRHKHGAGSPTSDLTTSPQSRHEGSQRHLGDSQEHESSGGRGHGSRSKSSTALVPSHGVCVCVWICVRVWKCLHRWLHVQWRVASEREKERNDDVLHTLGAPYFRRTLGQVTVGWACGVLHQSMLMLQGCMLQECEVWASKVCIERMHLSIHKMCVCVRVCVYIDLYIYICIYIYIYV